MHTTPVSLLERLRRQPDAQSWQQLVAIYQPWLRGWLQTHFLQAADAEDVVQEVLAVLVQEIGRFEHNGRRGLSHLAARHRRQSPARVSPQVGGGDPRTRPTNSINSPTRTVGSVRCGIANTTSMS